jgi:hypothetical protein
MLNKAHADLIPAQQDDVEEEEEAGLDDDIGFGADVSARIRAERRDGLIWMVLFLALLMHAHANHLTHLLTNKQDDEEAGDDDVEEEEDDIGFGADVSTNSPRGLR